jgi:predicted unusual protein kinase regulating ubiquinone biosynthesis (AarF/ABC1/UbiB family)
LRQINTELFHKIFSDDERIIVPKVHREFSSETIITTDFIDGRRFRDFLDVASQDEKNLAGGILFDFTFKSIFTHGIFNCDPNGGNFLFLDGKVAFIDFGCVKRFDENFMNMWKQLSATVINRDKESAIKLGVEIGMFPKLELIDVDYQFDCILSLYEPWLEDKTYRFSNEYVEKTWRKFVAENPDKYRLALPQDWGFTNRLQWGLCALLGELGAKSNWHQRWLEYTDYAKHKEDGHAV